MALKAISMVFSEASAIVGHDQIRDVLAGMIRAKTKLQSQVVRAITVDDVALTPERVTKRASGS
jgi:hypothetical protein